MARSRNIANSAGKQFSHYRSSANDHPSEVRDEPSFWRFLNPLLWFGDDASEWDKKEDKWYTSILKDINHFFNPHHQWFDYDSWNGSQTILDDYVNTLTGHGLTSAQIQANEMQMQNEQDLFARRVAGMQSAGLNPALLYSSGGIGSAPSVQGNVGTAGVPGMSDLMQLMMLRKQRKVMDAQADMYSKQGDAALINARANERNAGTNEANAGTNAFNAETARMRQSVDAMLARSQVDVNVAQIDKLAADAENVRAFTAQLPDRLSAIMQSANAQQKSAAASLQSSLASLRQAAVAEKLSDSEIALRESQVLVNWAASEGQSIVNARLDDKLQAEIQELTKRSELLGSNAANLDRNGKVQWMQTITGYVNAATSVANAVASFVRPMPGIKLSPVESTFLD